MYDPTVGRFITEDPIGFEAGDTNAYRYIGNNPTSKTDPTGLMDWSKWPSWLRRDISVAEIEKKINLASGKELLELQTAKKLLQQQARLAEKGPGIRGLKGKGRYLGIIGFLAAIGLADDAEGALVDGYHPVSMLFGGASRMGDAEIHGPPPPPGPPVMEVPEGLRTEAEIEDWNREWADFFKENPNASLSQILAHRRWLEVCFGL